MLKVTIQMREFLSDVMYEPESQLSLKVKNEMSIISKFICFHGSHPIPVRTSTDQYGGLQAKNNYAVLDLSLG